MAYNYIAHGWKRKSVASEKTDATHMVIVMKYLFYNLFTRATLPPLK